MNELRIGPVWITGGRPGTPVAICAEISSNHMGSLDRALRLIEAAKIAGADLVKLQVFTLDEILALRGDGRAAVPWDHLTTRELYTQALTPFFWLPKLFGRAAELGIVCFASVFGLDSLSALEKLNCPAYKIAKSDAWSGRLVDAAISTQKPVLASYGPGGRSVPDAERPRSITPIHRVYCPEGYPSTIGRLKLWRLSPYSASADAFIGLSSHCLDPVVAPLAVALGARYLEYHLMLEPKAVWSPDATADLPALYQAQLPLDAPFSHVPSSFKAMVESVRHAEAILGV